MKIPSQKTVNVGRITSLFGILGGTYMATNGFSLFSDKEDRPHVYEGCKI